MGNVSILIGAIVLAFGSAGPRAAAAPPAAGLGSTTQERFVIVPAESEVAYRVGEVFFSRNNQVNVAVGTTNAIRGEVWLDRSDPGRSRIGPITVDISTFASDQERRDRAIRAWWLESSRFPTAQFTPTAIHGLPRNYVSGRTEHVQIAGDLRIRQVMRPVTFDATLKFDGGVLSGVATTAILMADFGFAPPSILGILKAENQVQVGFRFTARAAG